MTASRDETESTYFVIGTHAANVCIALDDPYMDGSVFFSGYPILKSWTVCEHLSTPEKALAYHQEKRPVLIVHGFVLCQECNNRNILTGQDGFNTMLRFSMPQDDLFFHRFIMKTEASDAYCHRAKLRSGRDDKTEKRRQVCVHLNTAQKLQAHYASKKILYWHQDILLCAACLEDVKNGERDSIDDDGVMLQDRLFTELVVAPLCLINNEHFGLQKG